MKNLQSFFEEVNDDREGEPKVKTSFKKKLITRADWKDYWKILGHHKDQVHNDAEKGAKADEDPTLVDWSPEGEEPHKSIWFTIGNLKYLLVDGAFIRNRLYIDYVEGGHHWKYDDIPEDEIWIEDAMNQLDTVATALHETDERWTMSVWGWSYEKAHDKAAALEQVFRNMVMEENWYVPAPDQIEIMLASTMVGRPKLVVSDGNGNNIERDVLPVQLSKSRDADDTEDEVDHEEHKKPYDKNKYVSPKKIAKAFHNKEKE